MNEVCSSDNHYTMPWQNSFQTMLIYQKSRFNQSLFSVRDFIPAPISLKTLNNYRTSWLSEVYDFPALSGYVALDFSLICFWVYWNTKMSQKHKTEKWKKKNRHEFYDFLCLEINYAILMIFLKNNLYYVFYDFSSGTPVGKSKKSLWKEWEKGRLRSKRWN